MKGNMWKVTWRDHDNLDWLCEIESCDDAIESLKFHISCCDRCYESSSIREAEDIIYEIMSEMDEREQHPEWPTVEQMKKFCGKYLVSGAERNESMTWNLTPELLRTRWTSEDDFYQWMMGQYGVREARVEPMPEVLL
jgi:hypothetical protein